MSELIFHDFDGKEEMETITTKKVVEVLITNIIFKYVSMLSIINISDITGQRIMFLDSVRCEDLDGWNRFIIVCSEPSYF